MILVDFTFNIIYINIFRKDKNKAKSLDVMNYFKELPFYNTCIEKTKTKRLKNLDLPPELSSYEKLSVLKEDKAFRAFGMICKVEWIDKNIHYLN